MTLGMKSVSVLLLKSPIAKKIYQVMRSVRPSLPKPISLSPLGAETVFSLCETKLSNS